MKNATKEDRGERSPHPDSSPPKKPTFKERAERNFTLWSLGLLIAGFIAGWGAFKAVQEASKGAGVTLHETIPKQANQFKEEKTKYMAQMSAAKGKIIRIFYKPSYSNEAILIKNRLDDAGARTEEFTTGDFSPAIWYYDPYSESAEPGASNLEAAIAIRDAYTHLGLPKPKAKRSAYPPYDIRIHLGR